jgi:23S rRNA (adenine2503-C2)-methyltransferase
LDIPLDQWEGEIVRLGEKPYRVSQLASWIFEKRVAEFNEMSDLPEPFRAALSSHFCLRSLLLEKQERSQIDGTIRLTFATHDGERFSAVFLPVWVDGKRGTKVIERASLCLSTQVGCAWGCVFCASGRVRFERNLRASEMVEQVLWAEKAAGAKINSILFMGMGEPLANYDNLLAALKILRSSEGLGYGARHVTVSTCGLVPQILRLAEESPKVNLAISLHAVDQEKRAQLLPKSSRWDLKELLMACRDYAKRVGGDHLTFEYILLDGVNDSEREAKRLANFMRNKPGALVNLIVYNPVPGLPYRKPSPEKVAEFQKILTDRGVLARVRKPQGVDIGSGCGQLGAPVR